MFRTLSGAALAFTLLATPLSAQKNVRQPSGTPAPSGPTRAAGADATAGTWSNGQLTITLQRSGSAYSGMATMFGERFPVRVAPQGGVLVGSFSDEGEQVPLRLVVQGDVMQVDADGEQHTLRRQGSGAAGGVAQAQRSPSAAPPRQAGPARTQAAPNGGGAGGASAGGLAATAQDQQIVRLLLSSRWCSFRYSQISGTTSTEQATFTQDGWLTVGSQRESQSSNQYGSVYGSSSGGERYRWRIRNGMLMTTQDGATWSQTPLQITRNSNGYPIINADGKEYSQCN